MFYFEVSKLVDYIYKYGCCILSIRQDNGGYEEIEINIVNNSLNIDNDALVQILSLLYLESFLPKIKMEKKRYQIIKPKILSKYIENDLRSFITIKLCILIEEIISNYPFDEKNDISVYQIYDNVKIQQYPDILEIGDLDNIANYYDEYLIPKSIMEFLEKRKKNVDRKDVDSLKAIYIVREINELKDKNDLNKSSVSRLLEKYNYANMEDEVKEMIDEILKQINYGNDDGYSRGKRFI